MKKLTQTALAQALGITQGMVSRLKQQGMPTHSIVAAAAWRQKYLDPSLVKGNRMPGWQ